MNHETLRGSNSDSKYQYLKIRLLCKLNQPVTFIYVILRKLGLVFESMLKYSEYSQFILYSAITFQYDLTLIKISELAKHIASLIIKFEKPEINTHLSVIY